MKNAKLLLVLTASAVLALGSCGGNNDTTSESASSGTSLSLSSSVSDTSVAPAKYNVTVVDTALVDLSASKASAEEGETITITYLLASEAVVLDRITVNGVALEADTNGAYHFVMPAEAVTITAVAHEKKAINYVKDDEDPVLLIPEKRYAEPGEVVYIAANYNDEEVELIAVMAGNIVCGEAEDGRYYFVMPNEDVNLVPVYMNGVVRSVVNTDAHTSIDVHSAREGDSVNFSVSVDVGYDFVDVTAVDAEGEAVELIEEADGTYSFTMPASIVYINARSEVGYFEIEWADANIYSITYGVEKEDGEVEYVSSNDRHFPYGSMIRVTARDDDENLAQAVALSDGTRILRDEENVSGSSVYFYFLMPAHKVSLALEKDELLHNLVVDNTEAEHFNFSLYRKDETGAYVPYAGALAHTSDFEFFIKAELVDGVEEGDYDIASLTLSYETYTYNEDDPETQTRNLLTSGTWTTGLNEDGYYGFKLSVSTAEHLSADGEINLKAIEKNLTAYKGEPFVGAYLGFNIYSNNHDISAFSIDNAKIDGSGAVMHGTTERAHINSVDEDAGILNVGNDGSEKIAYGENTLLSHYALNTAVLGQSADWYMYVRKENETDSKEDYSTKAEMFTIDKHTYAAAQFFHNGEAYANIFVDFDTESKTGVYYVDDVEFVFTEGEYVTDAKVNYEVLVDDVPVAGIGTVKGSVGGYANRMLLDGLQGTYAVTKNEESEDLVLDGANGATFEGYEWTYSFDDEEDTLTLTRIEESELGGIPHTVTITLDSDEKTGIWVGEKVEEPTLYDVSLSSSAVSGPSSYNTYTHKQFTDNEDGTYSCDIAAGYSITEMAVTANIAGKLSFKIKAGKYTTSYSNYFYATVYVNGVAASGYEVIGSTDSDPEEVEVNIVVKKGDVVQIAYISNNSYSYYLPNYFHMIVSDMDFALPGNEAGEYAVSDGTTLALDGFGTGYSIEEVEDVKKISYSYQKADESSPWLKRNVNVVGVLDIEAKTITIESKEDGDLAAATYKGFNMYQSIATTASLGSSITVSTTNDVSGTRSGSISEYDDATGELMIGTGYAYYNAELDIFWTSYYSGSSTIGNDTYIFFSSNVASVKYVGYKSAITGSDYTALLRLTYFDGSIRYIACYNQKIYADVTWGDADFDSLTTSTSVTVYDSDGNEIFTKA